MNKFAEIFEIDDYQVLIFIDKNSEDVDIVSIKARSDHGISGTISFEPNEDTTIQELFEVVATRVVAEEALARLLPVFKGEDIE